MSKAEQIDQLEHLFRHSYGKTISVLLSKFGAHNLQTVEDAVQDALFKAAQIWSFKEVPHNPEAWLIRVAHHKVIDAMRRKQRWNDVEYDIRSESLDTEISTESFEKDQIIDQELQMVFACCHPSLPVESQIILTLKLIAGFGNKEVAAILLKKEEAVAKAFTRAKKRWVEKKIRFDVPVEMGLRSRLHIVLKVIYLIFTEGYKPTRGDEVVRRDVCYEAIRLALLLDQNKFCSQSSVKALLALMCFHTSRFDARLDSDGTLVDLEHQDRSTWNRELINRGTKFLNQAYQSTDFPFDYLLQAYVSYYHCIAGHYQDTNWRAILDVYDLQMIHNYSPVVELNRVIPYYKVYGVQQALDLLDEYEKNHPTLLRSLFYAFKGELLMEQGLTSEAIEAFETALIFMNNQAEIAHIQKKLHLLAASG